MRTLWGNHEFPWKCWISKKFHEKLRNRENAGFRKIIKLWKWSPGGPPIKPSLINNQCVRLPILHGGSNGFLVISWFLPPPKKMNKMYLFGGGGSGGPKWTEIAKSQKCENAENEWKLRFWMKKCVFWWFSWNFTYFHEMCAPAPRPPENLARTMLFQWFWGVVFGPNPKSW